ncbi:ABC-type Fe3+-siderophore transport system, permease 2 component [Pseudonocardia sp. Ae168_Ps1]|uniref:FecCD family ABC transporter permease n=1 Tax=unclassified Pseudonocardia TaxID=2619320 RepID=UPI00095B9747|nr:MULTISPECIES: iron chelate uptake ABC transporter family permease subunit [unclassified Pseudonocardia]OLL76209.1 ABC-type Fe3+-siderophore transport system, permease 2 component [Pseudonocardia sp. Ae150A_Ps1]OLL82209.1 ABC-type Fe3+-siderophore transport system, permease 2 component [Pseudonocardia sp. Ae168_Ps1]OLL83676.1 ABC-type Fe3+-siderophore transport system, permease 2 component [Pseudonocardia sp. Ae263_Ps1]OLL90283.1 ABC-type Fe3+-siderophore transport system, permease 2 componen
MSAPPDTTDATGGVGVLRGLRARRRRRVLVSGAVVAAAVLAAFVVTLSAGAQLVPPPDVVAALLGSGSPRTELVVLRLRLPRALTAVLVGAALGLAGALFQRLLRNQLASPDIIGISAGASAAAVAGTVLLGLSAAGVSVAAVLGAVATTVLILALTHRDGLHGVRFVLVGLGIGTGLLAVVSFLMIRASLTSAQENLVWLTGSINQADWSRTVPLVAACAVLVPLALVLARALPRLELGDDTATALGLPVGRARLALIAVGVLLVATAVAAAGPVSFVALVCGPLATRAAGPGNGSLPHTAGIGALVVLVSDLVARHLVNDVALPVGVVTGAVGAPYLLWLLARARTRGTT